MYVPIVLVSTLLLATLLFSLPAAAAILPDPTALGSRDLTADEFTSVVFSKPTLVKFFSPFCGHCKALAPIWDDAAKLIHRTHPNVQLVGVDCTKHGDVCSAFNVHGYPTIKLVRPAETDAQLLAAGGADPVRMVYAYPGQRTALAFEQFVSVDANWQSVAAEPYPLALPASSVPLQLSSQEQRAKTEAAAERSKARPADSVVAAANAVAGKLGEAEAKMGGGLLAAAAAAAGGGAGLLYGEWLNVALGAVMLIIGLIGYCLYMVARSSERSIKAV